MDFYDILDHVIDLLQHRGKASYRALKLQFKLDDTSLDVLKDELIKVYQLARDQDGEMLVGCHADTSLFLRYNNVSDDTLMYLGVK